MTTFIDDAEREFTKQFVIKSNAGTGLLRYTDADKIKSFYRTKFLEYQNAVRERIVNIQIAAREIDEPVYESEVKGWDEALQNLLNDELLAP